MFRNRKECGLEPGVAFRIADGKNTVDVLICFKCDVLGYVVGGANEVPTSQYQDFDPVRAELVALTKEAFPNDADIRELADENPH